MKKTNAVRILESLGISFQTREYISSEDEFDAVSVAEKVGVEPEQVFKTLVARNEKGALFVFVIPGNFELDLKKGAKISGSKKIELIKVKELLPLTGYVRGGCSPIGMKKSFPTFIDETAQLFESIFVSAGVRGMQLKIKPADLCLLVEANFADLI
ncbi:MAG: Cys-tRNA(Pro) deacylase [Melioribacteraceae bacterium]|nr:Cys-tRNA(Pro) deacylase [Melioribacteraceae bacterium]